MAERGKGRVVLTWAPALDRAPAVVFWSQEQEGRAPWVRWHVADEVPGYRKAVGDVLRFVAEGRVSPEEVFMWLSDRSLLHERWDAYEVEEVGWSPVEFLSGLRGRWRSLADTSYQQADVRRP
jgi:hypothetical protein